MTNTDDHILSAGRAALAQGQISEALTLFFKALAAAPTARDCRRAVIDTLGLLDGFTIPPKYQALLAHAATDPAIDPAPLPRIARNILWLDPRFAALERSPLAPGQSWFYDSPLLLEGLTRTTVADEALATLLTQIRREILLSAVSGDAEFLRAHPSFVVALAQQCVLTRHIWRITAEESAALLRLAETNGLSAADINLLRSLCEPLDTLELAHLPDALKTIVAQRAEERALSQRAQQLTPVTAGVSAQVKAQYEAYPYPLWREASLNEPLTWPDVIARFAGPTPDATPSPATLDILIAGCGTGRSTALMASLLPAARILAVDLSRTSLGYAMRQAREHQLTNVSFGIADILRLGELGRQFHLVECGGVLHHMAEPARGLKALSDVLVAGGLMNIALYSERARSSIIAARAFIAEQGFDDDLTSMRAAREAILALPAHHPARRVTRRPDFYSADALHDLLFNVHEVHFTPAGLKGLLAHAGLTFLGFNLSKPVQAQKFRAAYPDDPLGRNLDNWEAFERQHSDTFTGMLNFWLQKPL
jgi:SAM-dependent methyltransferase